MTDRAAVAEELLMANNSSNHSKQNEGGSGGEGRGGSRPDGQPRGEGRMDRIARRAHEIYERRGGEHGKAIEDWLQAEREIDAESDR